MNGHDENDIDENEDVDEQRVHEEFINGHE